VTKCQRKYKLKAFECLEFLEHERHGLLRKHQRNTSE